MLGSPRDRVIPPGSDCSERWGAAKARSQAQALEVAEELELAAESWVLEVRPLAVPRPSLDLHRR